MLWCASRLRPTGINAWIVAAYSALFSAVFIIALPTFSSDSYVYVLSARVFTEYHANLFSDDENYRSMSIRVAA